MKRLIRHRLRVQGPEPLDGFYGDLLGMTRFDTGGTDVVFGYDDTQCGLQFLPTATESAMPRGDDFYWKTGITLRNLDAAVAHLRGQGLSVPDPRQFRDIGYLTHIADPNGLAIELLQQGFEGREDPVPDGHPIGAQATLAHITLRVTDLGAAQDFFGNRLGMRLMSVQPVSDFGFCLYFYAWSEEALPDPDLTAVANREWLWRRPYTLIELQHLETPGARVQRPALSACGFDGFAYAGDPGNKPVTLPLTDLGQLS